MRSLALLFSGLFHPLFIPTIICLAVFFLQPLDILHYNQEHRLVIVVLVFLSTAMLPMLFSFWYIWSGETGDYMLNQRKNRTIPYASFAINSFILFYFFRNQGLSELIYLPIFAAAVVVVIVLIINFYWKISAHLAALGGLIGILLAYKEVFLRDSWLLLLISILVTGLVASSRLFLKAHSKAQLFAGFLIGFLFVFTILLFL